MSSDYVSLDGSSARSSFRESIDFPKTTAWKGKAVSFVKEIPHWHDHAISSLNKVDEKLDRAMPNLPIQAKLDAIGELIGKTFEPLKEFSEWLDQTGNGKWYEQLTLFLAKLPMKAVRNIVRLLYQIIRELLYAAVHPLKALNKAAKLIVNLLHELTKPETWTKIGAGMIGAGLGQALVTGNPISVIGMGIGVALVVGGLSFGALKAAVLAEEHKGKAALKNVASQMNSIPESVLTGFLMGLMLGGIQRATAENAVRQNVPKDNASARQWADNYAKHHGVESPDNVSLQPNGLISMSWNAPQEFSFLDHNTSGLLIGPWHLHHAGLFENVALSQSGLAVGGAVPFLET